MEITYRIGYQVQYQPKNQETMIATWHKNGKLIRKEIMPTAWLNGFRKDVIDNPNVLRVEE